MKKTILLISLSSLTACTTLPPKQQFNTQHITNMVQQSINNNEALLKKQYTPLSDDLINSLIPTLNQLSNIKPQPEMLDIHANNAPAQNFFATLAKDIHSNIIVDPKINNNITLNLNHVSMKQVMAAIHDNNGYEYKKTIYGYIIYQPKLITKTFTINYLNISRKGKSETSVSAGQLTNEIDKNEENKTLPASNLDTEINNHFWKTLTATLNEIIDKKQNESVVVNPQAGTIIIKAFPEKLQKIQYYLNSVQNIMNREVIIDAKILSVTLDAQFESGIDWQLLNIHQNGLANFTDTLKPFTGIFSLAATGPAQFSALIRLLNTQGRVNVLSSPRIATINNQKALIKVGSDEFFVTGVESNTDTSAGAANTSENIDLTPFFSGVALDVTPQINQHNDIILHVHPIVSEVTGKDKKFTVSGKEQNLPLAFSTIREADSIVRVKNKQVVVIGGLMENQSSQYRTNTPLLSHIPLIGNLFKRKNDTASKNELVILLQPIIENHQTQQEQLTSINKQFEALNQDFRFNTILKQKKIDPILNHKKENSQIKNQTNTFSIKTLSTIKPAIDKQTLSIIRLIKKNNIQQAQQTLDTLLKKYPDYSPFVSLNAYLLMKNKQTKQALALLEKYQPNHIKENPYYFSFIAALYLQQGDYQKASFYYEQLTQQNKQNGDWWAGLSISLHKLGQTQHAEQAYEQAQNTGNLSTKLAEYLLR